MRFLALAAVIGLIACDDDGSARTDTTSSSTTDATTSDSVPDTSVSETAVDSSEPDATATTAPDATATTEPDATATTEPDAVEDTTVATEVLEDVVQPPTIMVTSHVDGQRIVGSRDVVVYGTADATVSAMLDGAPVDVTMATEGFSLALTLADQHNHLVLSATNDGGTTTLDLDLVYPYVALETFQPATVVLGQADFISGATRAISSSTLNNPFARITWHDGHLYLDDIDNNRVLVFVGFPTNNRQPADYALGQPEMFTAIRGFGRERLNRPASVSIEGERMIVADRDNTRLLLWDYVPSDGTTPADHVLGQPVFTPGTQSCTRTGLGNMDDIMIVDGKIIVSDSSQHRVLIWNAWPTSDGQPADMVLGQKDFTHCVQNDGDGDGVTDGPSATTVNRPGGIWSDGTRLFIADYDNNRVLFWNTFPTSDTQPADGVLGQAAFDSNTAALGAAQMSRPRFIASNGNQMAIAEEFNNRVLVWNSIPSNGALPDVVLGQGDLEHGTQNDDNQDKTSEATPTARTFFRPRSLAFVDDTLVVGDSGNNRYVVFGTSPCPPNTGVIEYPPDSGTCVADPCATATCEGLRQCVRAGVGASCECPRGLDGDCDTCLMRIDSAATGADDGSSWSDAYTSVYLASELASGLTAAFAVTCELWFREGTHAVYETSPLDSLRLRGDMAAYGGFAGDELTRDARHGGATILDGGNVARHIVTSLGDAVVVDGFTLQHAYAAGSGDSGRGGGILANGKTTVRDCVIQDNTVIDRGGGIFATTNLTLERVSLLRNRGTIGGGLRVQSGVLTITDVVVAYNHGGTSGGGLDLDGGSGTVTDVLAYGNTGTNGGGIRVNVTNITVTGATIVGNYASAEGGGIQNKGPLNDAVVRFNDAPLAANISSVPVPAYCDDVPTFVNAPRAWDVVRIGDVDAFTPMDLARFAVDDVIEIDGDDVARVVTAVDTAVHFTPALAAAPSANATLANWGPGAVDLVEDFTADASSPCSDWGYDP